LAAFAVLLRNSVVHKPDIRERSALIGMHLLRTLLSGVEAPI
jgi:hypothetical protein